MNRIFGVLEICELARAGPADFAAGRRQSLGDAVITERALFRGVGLRVDEAATVRACLHTVAASEAVTLVDENDAVGRDEGCANGANLCAGRVRAVITQFGNEEVLAVADLIRREAQLAAIRRFDFGSLDLIVSDMVALDPSAEVAVGDIVLFRARADATSATDALGNVDQHAPPVLGHFVVRGSLRGSRLNVLPGDGSCGQQDEEAPA